MIALLLIPAFAVADRFIGWGGDTQHRKSIGFLVALGASVGIAFTLSRWDVAVIGVAWIITRTLPFKPPFGTIAIHSVSDGVQTLLRWLLPALGAAAWALDVHQAVWPYIASLVAFSPLAVVLAVILAILTKPGTPPLSYDPNAYVETLRGALFGVALTAIAVT